MTEAAAGHTPPLSLAPAALRPAHPRPPGTSRVRTPPARGGGRWLPSCRAREPRRSLAHRQRRSWAVLTRRSFSTASPAQAAQPQLEANALTPPPPTPAARLLAAARPGAHPRETELRARSLPASRDAERAAAAQGEQPLQTHLGKWPGPAPPPRALCRQRCPREPARPRSRLCLSPSPHYLLPPPRAARSLLASARSLPLQPPASPPPHSFQKIHAALSGLWARARRPGGGPVRRLAAGLATLRPSSLVSFARLPSARSSFIALCLLQRE